MNQDQPTPKKIKVTLALTKEAYDTLYLGGYASDRTAGEFISGLIVAHDAKVKQERDKPLTKAQIVTALRQITDALERSKK